MPGKISVDKDIMGGDPCVDGTRIPVALILSCLADGYTKEDILKDFPVLTADDVDAALVYAARMCVRPKR
ncbi:MAG: DUF433 domain-containing protein [Bacillota bacterium]